MGVKGLWLMLMRALLIKLSARHSGKFKRCPPGARHRRKILMRGGYGDDNDEIMMTMMAMSMTSVMMMVILFC